MDVRLSNDYTNYINAYVSNVVSLNEVVEVSLDVKKSDSTILDNTQVKIDKNGNRCIVPNTLELLSKVDIEEKIKRDCVALDNKGNVYNDITSMVYTLWEEVQRLKLKI